jgi:hypothetical protein
MTTQVREQALNQRMARITEIAQSIRPAPALLDGFTHAKEIRLVAEGDSWFDYIPRTDILAQLENKNWQGRKYLIKGKPRFGSYLNDMVYHDGQRADYINYIQDFKPHAFLFSGGGNDIAGDELLLMLFHRDAAAFDATGAHININPNVLGAVVNEIFQTAYLDLIDLVRRTSNAVGLGDLPMIFHGYGYVIPDGDGWGPLDLVGPWLHPRLQRKGYDKTVPIQWQQRVQIMKQFIDAFNTMLLRVQKMRQKIYVADLRPLLPSTKEYWANELHPTKRGFEIAAAAIEELLQQAVP